MNQYGGHQDPVAYPGPSYARDPNTTAGSMAPGLDAPPRHSAAADSARDDFLYAPEEDPDEIVTEAPREKFRLGYVDGICLVINRMIGMRRCTTPFLMSARMGEYPNRLPSTPQGLASSGALVGRFTKLAVSG